MDLMVHVRMGVESTTASLPDAARPARKRVERWGACPENPLRIARCSDASSGSRPCRTRLEGKSAGADPNRCALRGSCCSGPSPTRPGESSALDVELDPCRVVVAPISGQPGPSVDERPDLLGRKSRAEPHVIEKLVVGRLPARLEPMCPCRGDRRRVVRRGWSRLHWIRQAVDQIQAGDDQRRQGR